MGLVGRGRDGASISGNCRQAALLRRGCLRRCLECQKVWVLVRCRKRRLSCAVLKSIFWIGRKVSRGGSSLWCCRSVRIERGLG